MIKLETLPKKQMDEPIPTFDEYFDKVMPFGNFLEQRIQMLATYYDVYEYDVLKYGRYEYERSGVRSPSEQYQFLITAKSLLKGDKPKIARHRAFQNARAFQIVAKKFPGRLARQFRQIGVPQSRRQAGKDHRLAKLLVGESVWVSDEIGRFGQVWYAESRLVNKVAHIMSLLDECKVRVNEVPRFLQNQGGVQACIKKHRETR